MPSHLRQNPTQRVTPRWDAFDPNFNPIKPWATYIPGRFKLHKTRGPALNVLSRNLRAILYEFVDGQWIERAKLDYGGSYNERPTQCEQCGGDTKTGTWNQGKVTRIKPGLVFKFLCPNCRRLVA